MAKILIADDHPLIRQGVKQTLAENPDLIVTDEAASGLQVLEKVRKGDFDVVILDLSMPGMSGIDVLKQIKKEKPGLAILILSRFSEEQYAIAAMKAGASGYVTKTTVVDELVDAVKKVLSGRKYISVSLAEKIAGELRVDGENPVGAILSDREREILRLIASGKTIGEIADQLCLSPTTISTYRFRLMRKMNLKSNAELTRYALEHDLIE
jgi:two-component system invasion response regulator UvrY